MFVTNGRNVACNVRTKEGIEKKEEGLNIEKKGKKIEITILNELEQLFLSISDRGLPFCSILFSNLYSTKGDKCLLQMVRTLHATSVLKKEEGRGSKNISPVKAGLRNPIILMIENKQGEVITSYIKRNSFLSGRIS